MQSLETRCRELEADSDKLKLEAKSADVKKEEELQVNIERN